MTVGEKIRETRTARGITQSQLSEATGIDGSTIRKYESGRLNPKIETIIRIAEGLSVDLAALQDCGQGTADTMKGLFSAFENYSGSIRSGRQLREDVAKDGFDENRIYLSFALLDDLLSDWLEQYEEYRDTIKEAELLPDEKDRLRYKEMAEKKYRLWMLSYSVEEQTGTSGQSDPKC